MQGRGCSPGFDRSASYLFLANCLDVLGALEDASVDCVITDPPYGIHYRSRSHALPLHQMVNDDAGAYDLLDKALALAARKLKVNSHIYVFTDWQAFSPMAAIVTRHFNLKNALVWVKNNHTKGDLKGNYSSRYEMGAIRP